jgi:hypothetical protein
MPPPSPGGRRRTRRLVGKVIAAALAVFLLDGFYVVVVFAGLLQVTTPERIFQGIARALLGPPAFAGGARTVALGVGLHFLVALGWSLAWAVAYERSATLRRRVARTPAALLVGAAYGIVVWLAMQFVVLPLTLAPPGPAVTPGGLLVLLAHILVVGPPIVLLLRRDGPPHS